MPKAAINEDDDNEDLREVGGARNGAETDRLEDVEEEVGEGEEIVLETEGDDERVGAGVEGQESRGKKAADTQVRDRADETPEQRRERRRIEKKEAKVRQREAMNRDKTELKFLRQLVDQMATQGNEIQEIRRAQVGTQVSSLDTRISQIESQIRQADEVIAAAVESQNGSDMVRAQAIRDKLVRSLDRLQQNKQQAVHTLQRSEQNGANPRQAQPQGPNPLVVAELRRFQQRNEWFDPSGSDEDSAMALAIDNVLTAEGKLDPSSPEYWTELERRIKKRMPHLGATSADDDDEDDDDDDDDDEEDLPQRGANGKLSKAPVKDQRQRSKGPRMPAGSSGGGASRPGTFYVSADRKQAMIEAGVWDDPKLRQRYLKKYREWDEANAPRGR